jgi:CBS-domain-containing membrane protein
MAAIWLKQHKLSDVFDTHHRDHLASEPPSAPSLYSVSPNDTVETICQILSKHNLYCLPVIEDGKALGLVDLNDLTTLLCTVLGTVTRENGLEKFTKAEQFGAVFFSKKASEVINLSEKNPYTPISTSGTLFDAVEKLVSGTQRLPLVDENGSIITLISPSSVIKYLSHFTNEREFQNIRDSSVANMSAKFVQSVEFDTPLIIALQQLNESKSASLAITENAQLTSTFTLKDLLKAISHASQFQKLFLPIGEYVTDIRRYTPKAIFPAIHCSIDSSIESVLLRLAATGIHRIFVIIPSSPRAIGVVSLRDLLTMIISL